MPRLVVFCCGHAFLVCRLRFLTSAVAAGILLFRGRAVDLLYGCCRWCLVGWFGGFGASLCA